MSKINMIRLVAFILTVLLGLGYAVKTIVAMEFPAETPVVYRFKTALADPYDPFRGRYVTLRPLPDLREVGDHIKFAILGRDEAGFATVTGFSDKLEAGKDCVRLSGNRYYKQLPFEKFFMNEKLAPEAERVYNRLSAQDSDKCVIVVKIYKDGSYAIEDLEVDGQSIYEYLKTRKEEK